MVDHYKLIAVTHKNLDVEDLAHFILRHDSEEELVQNLKEITARYGQDEVIYLSTCNRVIFLFHGLKDFEKHHATEMFRWLNPTFAEGRHINLDKVIDHAKGIEAVNTICEVAASIDSLVVGEREIFRQFRNAYHFCNKHNLAGDNMRILNNCTVRAAKDVYTNTEIGAKPVSVASLAIHSFLQKGVDKDDPILLIGAGETNRTIGRFLNKHGYQKLIIFNRSLDNAIQLSTELGAEGRHLGDLTTYRDNFSAVFACTSAQDPIITLDLWNHLNPDAEKKVVIDLSIPHNVADDVSVLAEVEYISVDSLRSLAERNLKFRSGNVAAARIIVKQHLDEFEHMYERRKVERAFKELPSEIREVKERALTKVYKDQIAAMPEEARELIEEIASYMEKKCVAVPMKMAISTVGEQMNKKV